MEDHKIAQFDGLGLDETAARLRAQGYAETGPGPDSRVFTHPLRPHSVLCLTPHCESAAAFAALCRAHADNPYFPRLGDCRKITGAEDFFIMTRERLENVRLRTGPTRSPLVGAARALTLLLEGDEAHAPVYEFMLQNRDLRAAVQAIAQAVTASITAARPSCLRYASGMDRALPLDEQETDLILFRTNGNSPHPVFAAPFHSAAIRDESERAALLQYAHILCARAHLPPAAAAPPAPPRHTPPPA